MDEAGFEAPGGSSWPFEDPPGAEAITLGRILAGDRPILLVTRDEDDGCWQFLDGEHVFEEDAEAVLLGEMLQFDPTLASLADLPRGWSAARSALGTPWRRAPEGPPSSR